MNALWLWLSGTNIQAAVIGPIITSVIAYIAFFVRDGQARKCKLAGLVQEIEELGIEHWCSAGSDTNNHHRCIKIQNKIQTFSWRIDQKSEENKKALIALRQSITSGDFDAVNRPAFPFEDPRILLINEKAKAMRKALGIKKHH